MFSFMKITVKLIKSRLTFFIVVLCFNKYYILKLFFFFYSYCCLHIKCDISLYYNNFIFKLVINFGAFLLDCYWLIAIVSSNAPMADCTNLSDNMLDNCVNPICSDLNTENSNHHSSTFETEKLSKDLMCKIDKDVHLKNDCYPPKNCQLSHSHSAEVEEEINDQLQKTNSSSFKEKFAHQYHEKLELSKQSSKIIDSFANLNDLKPTISINSTAIDFNVDNQSNTYSDKVQNNACTSKPQINSDELKSVSQVELSSNEQLNDIVELISDEYKSESNKNGAGDVDSMLIDQETLNLDENSTQLRFSCSTQKNTYSSNVLTDHLFAETTVAQSPNDCNSDFFPKLTCHLPTSTDEESDKESNVSAENSDFICELASSTALSALEESSLDSGIASLDDAENTGKLFTSVGLFFVFSYLYELFYIYIANVVNL